MQINSQTTHHKIGKTEGHYYGIGLAELMEFLMTAQSHGVPDNAAVHIDNDTATIHWIDKR